MERAKRFFYVCAGLFFLCAAYQLGAQSVSAQAPTPVYGIDMASNVSMTVVGRTIFWMGDTGNISALLAVPGTSPIVAIGAQGLASGGGAIAMLQDGDVYRKDSGAFSWQRVGNIFGAGPVPGLKSTWGEVKTRYR